MNPLDYYRDLGSEVLETEHGWANYYLGDLECYIENIFITKEARRSGHAKALGLALEEIARENGCKYMIGSTNTTKPGVERSIMGMLSFGYKYLSSSEGAIFFKKEL